MQELHYEGLKTQMLVDQMHLREPKTMDYNNMQKHKAGFSWICGQLNVRASSRDNTEDTPVPR